MNKNIIKNLNNFINNIINNNNKIKIFINNKKNIINLIINHTKNKNLHKIYINTIFIKNNIPNVLINNILLFLEFETKISINIYIPSSYPYFRTFWSLQNIKTNLKNEKDKFEKYFKNLILIHNNSYFKNWTNTITFEKDIRYFISKIKHSYFIK